jgi:uncharacterized protein (TIGR03435 family)
LKNSDRNSRSGGKKYFLAMATAALLLTAIFVCGAASPLEAQSTLSQAPAAVQTPGAQSPPSAAQPPATQTQPAAAPTPADDWMKTAGGKQQFDVASVKLNKSGMPPSGDAPHSNVALGPGAMFAPTGGLFNATNWPLLVYIVFAYKINSNQMAALTAQLPKWVSTSNYDIQARVDGNPSKDQMRMMMQSLLSDRFELAIHNETKQLSVYDLVLVKPGKTGPQLQPHPVDSACSNAPPASPTPGSSPAQPQPTTVAGGYPVTCGGIAIMPPTNPGRVRAGARNVSMALIASSFTNPFLGVDRPIVDQTALTGTFDFVIEFTPQIDTPLPPGANFTPDPTGPTFQEALKEQLGLKLDSATGSVDVFVVDHIEQPSEN